MATYCERAGLDFQVGGVSTLCSFLFSVLQGVRFTFDGQRLNAGDTAAGLGMEEGDTIEVFQEQQGGMVSASSSTTVFLRIEENSSRMTHLNCGFLNLNF